MIELIKPKGEYEYQIGLWGTAESGKTTYLAQLYDDILENRQDQGFRIGLAPGVKDFIQGIRDGLIEKHFPQETHLDPDSTKTYGYKIYRDVERRTRLGLLRSSVENSTEHALLKFTDAGGEWWEAPKKIRSQMQQAYKEKEKKDPIEELQECKGIIALLDIALAFRIHNIESDSGKTSTDLRMMMKYMENFFEILMTEENNTGYVEQKIAFCVSKVDLPLAWENRNAPEKLVQEFFPPKVVKLIDNYCKKENREFFSISSVGTIKNEYGEDVSPVDLEKHLITVSQETLIPYNLFTPIGWLMAQLSNNSDWLV